MRKMNRMSFCGIAALLGITVFGCGGESLPKRVPVSGSVTYKGKAVEGATVGFLGEGAPRIASGVTDKDGKFTLTTYEPNDGAIPGKHTVTVTKTEQGSDLMETTDRNANADPEAAGDAYAKSMARAAKDPKQGAKDLLPAVYSSPNTSPLRETVNETGPNEISIQLK
jgi:hypothetical protein